MAEFCTYSPFGRWNSRTVSRWALLVLFAASMAGGFHGQLCAAHPTLNYMGFVPCGAGLLLTLASIDALTRAHCRAMAPRIALVAVASLTFLLASHAGAWDAYASRWQREAGGDERARPRSINKYVRLRLERGIELKERVGTSVISGAHVPLCWLLEAVSVCVPALLLAVWWGYDPYCEKCRRWTVYRAVGKKRGVPLAAIRSAFLSGSASNLIDLQGDPSIRDSWMRYVAQICPACESTLFLTAHIEHRVENGKYSDVASDTLVANVVVSPDELARLIRTVDREDAPGPARRSR